MKTKGNVIVEDICVGDKHFEIEYGNSITVEVISAPEQRGEQWFWKSKKLDSGEIIDYVVTEGLSHYGPNLYKCEEFQYKT